MNIREKLANVQKELKAPKNQFNSFGKYNYRSCEDILEVAKPLCIDNGLVLTVSDEVVNIGERYYIMSVAKVTDIEDGTDVVTSAFARESSEKKGMDDSQITGTASSYARKYALNGLFCIDDIKDADTDEHKGQQPTSSDDTKITVKMLEEMATSKNVTTKQLLDKYLKETGKKCDDLKFLPQDIKQKYYNGLKEIK